MYTRVGFPWAVVEGTQLLADVRTRPPSLLRELSKEGHGNLEFLMEIKHVIFVV
jgi:hypothetical protein